MRDKRYDIAKALAIYLVVLGHMFNQYGLEQSSAINFFHMPVFFFISGFFLHHTVHKYTFKQVFINKIKTLFIPYFIWSFVAFVANLSMMFIHKDVELHSVKSEFENIFIYARSTWFFIMLFFSSIFLAVFVYHIKNALGKVLCITAWLLISVQPMDELFLLYKFKWLFPFMLLGYFWAEYKDHISVRISCSWFNCIVGIVFYILLLKSLYNDNFYIAYSRFRYNEVREVVAGMAYYLISIGAIVVCMLLAQKLIDYKVGHILEHVGRGTADIYVLHMFLVKFLAFKIPFSGISLYLFTIIYSVVIVIISLLIKHILRNSRLYNYSLGRY